MCLSCPGCEHPLTHNDFFIVRSRAGVQAKCGLCGEAFHTELAAASKAQRFAPITLHVSNTDPDKISFPARNWEAPADGYHAVEITNIQQADYWTRRINQIDTRQANEYRSAEREYWDEVTRTRRANIEARIGSDPRAQALFKAVKAFVDKRRAARYSRAI